jgi:hypothetical protein
MLEKHKKCKSAQINNISKPFRSYTYTHMRHTFTCARIFIYIYIYGE